MKIIASDYDGTLRTNGVSEQDRAAIERFRRAGHQFGIVTGRDLDYTQNIMGIDRFYPDFLICCTGALILDKQGKILYEARGRCGDFMQDIYREAVSMGAEYFTISDRGLKYFADTRGAIPFDIRVFRHFSQVNVRFPDEEAATAFVAYVQAVHSTHLSAYRNGRHVDMPPPGISKVTGIREYARRFPDPTIYTAGDNLNDLPMIEAFYGFAVQNAVPAVRAAAKHQCRRIGDMIAYLLENP